MLRPKFRFHLLSFLAVAFWLGIVANTHATLGLLLSDTNPKAVVPGWAGVTGKLTVNGIDDLPEEITVPVVITVQNATLVQYGTIYCPTLWVCNWTTYGGAAPVTSTDLDLNFWISNITGPVTITFEVNGESTDLDLPFAEITSLEARMAQDDTKPTIEDANFDQDVYLKAIFNPVGLPTGITFDDVDWESRLEPVSGTPWAKLAANYGPGHPTLQAQLGSTVLTKDVWLVKLTLKSTICSGGNFREILQDPPAAVGTKFGGTIDVMDANGLITAVQLPHWELGKDALPVLYTIGTTMKLRPKFTVEPADYPNLIYFSGAGGYEFDENSDSNTPNKDFEPPALTATSSFSPTVAHDKGEVTWSYHVGKSTDSGAGTGEYDVYLAQSSGKTDYITVVHTACDSVGGDTDATIFSGIWGKFAGRNVPKYTPSNNGSAMTYWYWGWASPSTANKRDLIDEGDGRCGAWRDFFKATCDLHNITVLDANLGSPAKAKWALLQFDLITFQPYITNKYYQMNNAYPYGVFNGKTTLKAQGSGSDPGWPGPFWDGHAGTKYAGKWYDPSYGGDYTSVIAWEAATLDYQSYLNDGSYLPNQGSLHINAPDRSNIRDTGDSMGVGELDITFAWW